MTIIIEDEATDSSVTEVAETLEDVVETLSEVIEDVVETFTETIQDIVEEIVDNDESAEDVTTTDQHSIQLGAITAAIEVLAQRMDTLETPTETEMPAEDIFPEVEVVVPEVQQDIAPRSFSGRVRRAWFGEE